MRKSTTPQRWTITSDKFLSTDQVDQLIKHLAEKRDLSLARNRFPQRVKDFYILRALLETGLRVFELCALIEGDFKGQRLVVRQGKGGKARTVLLTGATASLLREWLEIKQVIHFVSAPSEPMFPSQTGMSYSTRGVRKRVKTVFAEIGLPSHLSVHALRHTNASLLLSKGVSLPTIRDNLGHHSISVTNIYAHACGSIEAVDLLGANGSEISVIPEPKQQAKTRNQLDIVARVLRKRNKKRTKPKPLGVEHGK